MLLGLEKIILLIPVTIQSVYSKFGGNLASTFIAGRKHQVLTCPLARVILRQTHLAANERCPEKKLTFAKEKTSLGRKIFSYSGSSILGEHISSSRKFMCTETVSLSSKSDCSACGCLWL